MPLFTTNLLIGLLTVIFLPVVTLPLVVSATPRLGRRVGYLAMVPPLISFGVLLWLVIQAGSQPRIIFEIPWVPALGISLSFLFDGLSIFYGTVICGIGVLVCWYAAEYLGDRYDSLGRFYGYLLFFMSAMLGTVFSNNLLLLFIFWELTGIASFLLIGFFHDDAKSREGARQALIITAGTGLLMMAGVILFGLCAGSYSLAALIQEGLGPSHRGWLEVAGVLILIGAFGKSAQFPFHFWLPGAMAAPTPVSAYLHSATMVKLGVFLVARMLPIFQSLEIWFWMVCGVGFFTMLLGAFLAFRSDDLKAILAYSTISQLGFLMGAYGVGSRTGIQVDFLHVVSHVFYKGSLFMTAGIVDHCAGTRDVRKLGGLGSWMPMTAFSAAVGAAALAGLPLTTGYISKELLLTDLRSLGSTQALAAGIWTAMVAFSAILTLAFAARFFFGVFMGRKPVGIAVHQPGWLIQIPPFGLALAALLFGVFPGGLDGMVNGLKVAGLHVARPVHLALWHGFNQELLITLLVILGGTSLFLIGSRNGWRWSGVPRVLRFDAAFESGLEGLSRVSKRMTLALRADWPPAYLPIVISFLLIALTGAVLISPSQFFEGIAATEWRFGPLRTVVAVMISLALFGVVLLRRWSAQLLSLSVAGFFLTFYFVLYRAPDLAMTQILVESASVVMMLLLLSRFPTSQLQIPADSSEGAGRLFRIFLSVAVGLAMFLLVIFSDLHRHPDPIGPRLEALSQSQAEGSNAVNTILVDFRGFDTLGEITVVLIATIGGIGLMMRYKRGRSGNDPAPPPGFFLGEKRRP